MFLLCQNNLSKLISTVSVLAIVISHDGLCGLMGGRGPPQPLLPRSTIASGHPNSCVNGHTLAANRTKCFHLLVL